MKWQDFGKLDQSLFILSGPGGKHMNIILLVLGFILLLKGADWFVDGASSIASRFGIPQLIIGLTIVAMGTSLPEAFVSITAALKSNAAITIGNVVGSNILNVGIILGITALIRPLHIQNSTIKYEMPFMMLVTLVLILQGINHTISRFDGIVMWLFFLGYLYYIFKMSKNQMEETKIKKTNPLFIPLGLICLMVGSNFAVDAATNIAVSLGVSQRFIGLTIVALGTSLPELVTSVTAARKGNADIAIGNIIGSNIFNILFVVGSSALITPVPFESHFIIDSFVAILIGLVLYLCTKKTRVLDKKTGILLLVTYSIYFIYLLY